MMDNINDKEQLKRRNAQYMNDSNKRFKNFMNDESVKQKIAENIELKRKKNN
jgi:hypothetical protein